MSGKFNKLTKVWLVLIFETQVRFTVLGVRSGAGASDFCFMGENMEIVIAIVLFIVGIALVIKGGDLFVDSATFVAKALNVPTFIIGATIVSIATTMPEMIVSVVAAAEGKTDMAIGNAVGSVTANVALIMAVAMCSMTVICKRKTNFVQMLLLLVATATLLLSSLYGSLSIIGVVILFIIYFTFMIFSILTGKKQATVTPKTEKLPITKKQMTIKIILFIVGAGAIVGGSQLMVTYGSSIALWLGVPERVIAITLIAVGTSLPELVTTVTAIIKKESSLSVGNIIGANIIDITLILPLCSLVSGKVLPISPESIKIDLPVCILVTLVALIPIMIKERAYKWQGFLLIAMYCGYLALTI